MANNRLKWGLMLSATIAWFGCSIDDKADDDSAPFDEMVLIRGGVFNMGDESVNARPAHSVYVADFYLGKYEVTQQLWRAIGGTAPAFFTGDSLPVEGVDWIEVFIFCNLKSLRENRTPCYLYEGRVLTGPLRDYSPTELLHYCDTLSYTVYCNFKANGYRLPTEAEWEYAARGGHRSRHFLYSGSNELEAVAWWSGNAAGRTHAVGLKAPNELGLYDMSGNVIERCWDFYQVYTSAYQCNPHGAASGTARILRGGSYNGGEYNCLVSYRHRHPSFKDPTTGFRLCRNAN